VIKCQIQIGFDVEGENGNFSLHDDANKCEIHICLDTLESGSDLRVFAEGKRLFRRVLRGPFHRQ
jgi:hypothetical protein